MGRESKIKKGFLKEIVNCNFGLITGEVQVKLIFYFWIPDIRVSKKILLNWCNAHISIIMRWIYNLIVFEYSILEI